MSQKHPTHKEIMANSVGEFELSRRDFVTLLNREFMGRHQRWPNIEDCQELRDIYDTMYASHFQPMLLDTENTRLGRRFYRFCVPYHIDVMKAVGEFTRNNKYPFVEIIQLDLYEAFKKFALKNRFRLNHRFTDRYAQCA